MKIIWCGPIKGFCYANRYIWKIWIFLSILIICLCLYLIYKSYILLNKGYNSEHSTSNYFKNEENNQYAVIIDAGSSGSRAYIYTWPPHNGNPQHLLDIHQLTDEFGRPLIKRITPGLSSFSNEPFKASDYLSPLLQFAADHVPPDKYVETPLFILATAGMRLLPKNVQESILDDLRVDIPQNFSFHFPAGNVEVISGKQEGVYLWISVNYLLGRFDHSLENNDEVSTVLTNSLLNTTVWKKNTVGMLEMGGASLQIVYDVTDDEYFNNMQEKFKANLAEVNLGCLDHDTDHTYRLYVSTALGFSSDKVRDLYSKDIVKVQLEEAMKKNRTLPIMILDPCLSRETTEIMNTDIAEIAEKNITSIILKGNGNYDACYQKLIPYLNILCKADNCSMINPKLNYTGKEFYGFSEFWYTMEDVLRMGGRYNYEKFEKSSRDYCSTRWPVLQDRFQRRIYPLADRRRLKYQCFKSVWMSVVLHEGLKIPVSYKNFRSASVINGQHVQWSLGALLYRTRYFPLRTLHQKVGQVSAIGVWRIETFYQYIFYGCICIVFAAITIYLCRLQRIFFPSRLFMSRSRILSVESGLATSEQLLL